MGLAIVGAILLVTGGILYFVQRHYRQKLYSIKLARKTTVAELKQLADQVGAEIGQGSLREYVKLSGQIKCDTPLISELKQVPCVYYQMQVEREYEERVTERDNDGETREKTQRGSETIASNSQSTPFFLQDQSGEIEVDPSGAAIETVQVLNEFRPEAGSARISFGGFSLSVGGSLTSGRETIGYRYRESILPPDRRILIVATASDSSGILSLQKPVENRQKFIISLKSEDHLAQSTQQTATYTFYGMIACLGLGAILLVVGLIIR